MERHNLPRRKGLGSHGMADQSPKGVPVRERQSGQLSGTEPPGELGAQGHVVGRVRGVTRQPVSATPRMLLRERTAIALLGALGGRLGKRDFQKLLFLYGRECRDREAAPPYEFVPYRYGPYSFTAENDRERLASKRLLERDRWGLTRFGRRVAGCLKNWELSEFAERHDGLRGEALVARCYRAAPWYAIGSRIVGRVLARDAEAQRRIEAARPTCDAPALMTIGYEGRSCEGYLGLLLRAGATHLCDVRRNPISRKWGFSKGLLAIHCRRLDIEYVPMPELGIASAQRVALNSRASYDRLFEQYEATTLRGAADTLGRIEALIGDGGRVALTCFEREPEQCHRSRVVQALMGRAAVRFSLIDL